MIEIIPSTVTKDKYQEYEELTAYTRYGVNLHPVWLTTYIEAFGYENKDVILEARDHKSGKLCGLLPFVGQDVIDTRFLKLRRLVPCGYRPTDFFDILALPDMEYEVTKAVAHWLKTNFREWDRLMMTLIPYDSQSWAPLVDHLRAIGFKPDVSTDHNFLKIDTTGTFDDCLKNLGTKKQKVLRYQKNNLSRKVGEVEVEHISHEVSKYFDEFIEIYMRRRSSKNQSDPFTRVGPLYHFFKKIVVEYGSRNWLRLSILKANQSIIAYCYHFVYKNVDYYSMPTFLEEYEKYSPGRVLLAELIKNAFEDTEIHEFNFMRSEYPYKLWWAPERVPYVTIKVDNPWSIKNKLNPILLSVSKIKHTIIPSYKTSSLGKDVS